MGVILGVNRPRQTSHFQGEERQKNKKRQIAQRPALRVPAAAATAAAGFGKKRRKASPCTVYEKRAFVPAIVSLYQRNKKSTGYIYVYT